MGGGRSTCQQPEPGCPVSNLCQDTKVVELQKNPLNHVKWIQTDKNSIR